MIMQIISHFVDGKQRLSSSPLLFKCAHLSRRRIQFTHTLPLLLLLLLLPLPETIRKTYIDTIKKQLHRHTATINGLLANKNKTRAVKTNAQRTKAFSIDVLSRSFFLSRQMFHRMWPPEPRLRSFSRKHVSKVSRSRRTIILSCVRAR